MSMFDYKDYTSAESVKLIEDASRLSAYTNSASFSGLPAAKLLNVLGDVTGQLFASKIDVGIPEGWKELTPQDLNVSTSLVDKSGYFTIESQYLGNVLNGPQAKIFAQYDQTGAVSRVNLNFAGTNDLIDVVDYFNLNNREGAHLFEPILKVVKDFTLANGLSAKDVLISGYSLGAGLTNVMAEERLNLSDGFFADSDYMGFAVPKIYDNPDVVLNFGYENDVVHRATGTATTVLEALKNADFGLVNPDNMYQTTTDNLVLFNDVYASAIWNISPFSILNIPTAWYAHINGVTTDAISRIANSSFYEFTRQDSTVIVSDLTAISRGIKWVKDKVSHTSDHHGSSAFLIGTQYDDLIAGGSNSDYIDAGLGNDTIRAGLGVDHVDGNEGYDVLRLEGRGKDWHSYKMSDGTLFFVDKDGNNLVEADNIEAVSYTDELMSHIHHYEITDTGLIDTRPLMKWLSNGSQNFAEHTEGTQGDDVLTGSVVFARDGDDSLYGTQGDDVLHAGMGNDILRGGAGDDRLYGAEGDDVLIGGAGNDQLIGGIGNDTFVIDKLSGSDVIVDFNNDVGYQDVIAFSSDLFSDMATLGKNVWQSGKDVIVDLGSDYLTVNDSLVNDVLAGSVII